MILRLLALLPILLSQPLLAADLELASPFTDNAVLQREMKVPVWGWGTPGSKITVSFAGQERTATTAPNGTWRLDLEPLGASAEPQSLTVKDNSGATLTRGNLLVGEVWLASGQSNMDWIAGKSNVGTLARDVAQNKLPIREYLVDTGSSIFPCSRADSKGGWQGPEAAGNFSALALAFAAELQRELGVPVGILRASHGATPVETWTAYEGFAAQPDLKHITQLIEETDPSSPAGQAAFTRYYQDLLTWQKDSAKLIEKGGTALPQPPIPGVTSDWKGATRMHNKKVAPLIPYAIRGVIWCQGEHNSGDGKIYAAKKQALLDGWRKLWNRPDLPFYFTQLQCYGGPDPDSIGFADAREAQTLFYKNNQHVGMVVLTDLNPARPEGIHPFNKLDPGKRLARWALANDYGRKDLAFTGPMYESHEVSGGKVTVKFTQRGPGGGLMVGSKGLEADAQKSPESFVEPARETPGQAMQHFRLAGKDKVWHPATAVIQGDDQVIVSSPQVPEPIGVQYAYNNSPIGSNLYNRAGLPAIPFAILDGKQMFQEDLKKAEQQDTAATKPKGSLNPSSLMRNGMVLQRDQKIPVWGHGIPGTTVTVKFADQEKSTTVDEFQRWNVHLDAMPASAEGRDLQLTSTANETRVIKDVLVGDVWFLTGGISISGEVFAAKGATVTPTEPLPLVREFRIRTKTRRHPTPRKLGMEVGGGPKYGSYWDAMTFDNAERPPSVFGYHFAKAIHQPGVPLGLVNLGGDSPPLTWISLEGIQAAPGFEKERDEINLAFPNTESAQKALTAYIADLKAYAATITDLRKAGKEIPDKVSAAVPRFPAPPYNEWVSYTETATHTYNFCIAPNTPCGVRGVVWMPDRGNLGTDKSRYSAAVAAYANSLPITYGQAKVPFIFAHPKEGGEAPNLPEATRIDFTDWPKSLAELGTKLGTAAKFK